MNCMHDAMISFNVVTILIIEFEIERKSKLVISDVVKPAITDSRNKNSWFNSLLTKNKHVNTRILTKYVFWLVGIFSLYRREKYMQS